MYLNGGESGNNRNQMFCGKKAQKDLTIFSKVTTTKYF